jgi:hypothetical protein
MVIIPNSTAVVDGLTFTVGQITWTTGVNSFTVTTVRSKWLEGVCIVYLKIYKLH